MTRRCVHARGRRVDVPDRGRVDVARRCERRWRGASIVQIDVLFVRFARKARGEDEGTRRTRNVTCCLVRCGPYGDARLVKRIDGFRGGRRHRLRMEVRGGHRGQQTDRQQCEPSEDVRAAPSVVTKRAKNQRAKSRRANARAGCDVSRRHDGLRRGNREGRFANGGDVARRFLCLKPISCRSC